MICSPHHNVSSILSQIFLLVALTVGEVGIQKLPPLGSDLVRFRLECRVLVVQVSVVALMDKGGEMLRGGLPFGIINVSLARQTDHSSFYRLSVCDVRISWFVFAGVIALEQMRKGVDSESVHFLAQPEIQDVLQP